jgi:hypothetical protein
VDISLVDDLPALLQMLAAGCGKFAKGLHRVPTTFKPHMEFKKCVPGAIGLIRQAIRFNTPK